MKRFLALMGVSALVSIALADGSDVIARDGSVSAGGVSASRDGVSARGGGASVSASRDGVSARGGGSSVTASRDGASVRGGGTSVSASTGDVSTGHVNARGDREYDSLASWMEDLGRRWSGTEPADNEADNKVVSKKTETTHSSSIKQVSEATATSTDGGSAVAEARNTSIQKQN